MLKYYCMEKGMYDNLSSIKDKYGQLEQKINKLSAEGKFSETVEFSKQLSSIEDIVKTFGEYLKCEKSLNDAKEILSNEKDGELIAFAKEEIKEWEAKMPKLVEELRMLLIPKDPLDEKNVILEMRGAAGGDEANIFVGDLYEAYKRFCESNGWKLEVLNAESGSSGGYTNLTFSVKGDFVYSKLKYESGVHRVQRVPKTESQGRIHTSTISIAVLPEVDAVDVKIIPTDLKIDTFRSSGAGGQHVNTTDSAVRITHLPTGAVAASQDGRSQHDNKDKAMKMLLSKIYEAQLEKQESETKDKRRLAVGSGARSEKIRTYNYPQNRVTDHRIGLTLNNLDKVMEGKFNQIIDGLITFEQNRLLEDN